MIYETQSYTIETTRKVMSQEFWNSRTFKIHSLISQYHYQIIFYVHWSITNYVFGICLLCGVFVFDFWNVPGPAHSWSVRFLRQFGVVVDVKLSIWYIFHIAHLPLFPSHLCNTLYILTVDVYSVSKVNKKLFNMISAWREFELQIRKAHSTIWTWQLVAKYKKGKLLIILIKNLYLILQKQAN